MPSGFLYGGVDLDDIFQAGSRGAPNSGYTIGGSDLNNRYAQWDGSGANQAPATGMGTPYGDLNIFYQKKTTVGYSAPNITINCSAVSPSGCRAAIYYERDGTLYTTNQENPGTNPSFTWWNPPTFAPPPGDSKYVYCQVIAGSAPNSFDSQPINAWLLINAGGFGRVWAFTSTPGVPGSASGTWRIYFSNDGSTIAHSHDVTWTAVQT